MSLLKHSPLHVWRYVLLPQYFNSNSLQCAVQLIAIKKLHATSIEMEWFYVNVKHVLLEEPVYESKKIYSINMSFQN
jgi:hypothetical protein